MAKIDTNPHPSIVAEMGIQEIIATSRQHQDVTLDLREGSELSDAQIETARKYVEMDGGGCIFVDLDSQWKLEKLKGMGIDIMGKTEVFRDMSSGQREFGKQILVLADGCKGQDDAPPGMLEDAQIFDPNGTISGIASKSNFFEMVKGSTKDELRKMFKAGTSCATIIRFESPTRQDRSRLAKLCKIGAMIEFYTYRGGWIGGIGNDAAREHDQDTLSFKKKAEGWD